MAKQPRPGQEAKSPIYKRLWFAIAVAVAAGLLTLTVIGWLWGEGGIFSLRRIFSFWILDLHAIDKAEYIKSALALVGGIGGVVYLVVKYRERAAAERDEARADRKEAEERLLAAVQQLGSESQQVRIAGVYALADVADTYLGDYKQRVVNILCGYLRTKRGNFVARKPEKDMVEDADVKTGGAEAPRVYESDDGPVESTILEVLAAHLRTPDAPSHLSKVPPSLSWSSCKLDFRGGHFIEPIEFVFCTVEADLDISSCYFANTVSFTHARFCRRTICDRSSFHDQPWFDYCNFDGLGSFYLCTFHKSAIFDQSTFHDEASFNNCTFHGRANFLNNTILGAADFTDSIFQDWASFDSSTFNGGASFDDSTFNSSAIFYDSTFTGLASFDGSTFAREDQNAYQKRFERSPFGPIPLEDNGLPEGARWDDDPAPSDDETAPEDSPPDGDTALPDEH